MKKIANIILLVAGILGIISAVGYAIASIVMLVLGAGSTEIIIQGLQDGSIQVAGYPNEVSAEQAAAIFKTGMTVAGVIFLLILIFAVVEIVLTFRARKVETQGSYIAVLVFAVLSGNLISLIGSIFGLVGQAE